MPGRFQDPRFPAGYVLLLLLLLEADVCTGRRSVGFRLAGITNDRVHLAPDGQVGTQLVQPVPECLGVLSRPSEIADVRPGASCAETAIPENQDRTSGP